MKPKATIIYCLKNPADHNRIFYVGRTTQTLQARLRGHINGDCSSSKLIRSILAAGKRPTIHELERCEGYLQPMIRERYWANKYNRREQKLVNRFSNRKYKHHYW
jgi:hypothetical protein